MSDIKIYTTEEQKRLGAFYTPELLADFLSYKILSLVKLDKSKHYTVVDPATGDSALLKAFLRQSKVKGINISLVGIDIDKQAIDHSRKEFFGLENNISFIQTDGLYPYNSLTPNAGWDVLKRKFLPNGIDFIVSNPPWGTDKSNYINLSRDFLVAKGQYDIYDLFLETIINNLNENGCYGIIIPDSIYALEHNPIRKLLFQKTTIKSIVRLGEGFFQDVNIAATLVFGIKKHSTRYNISCVHLSNEDRKLIISNQKSLYDIYKHKISKVSSKLMIDANYSFLTNIQPLDFSIAEILNKCPTVGEFVTSQRGIELSKKGRVVQCNHCGKWLPEPKGDIDAIIKCPHCKTKLLKKELQKKIIISKEQLPNSLKLIIGESIYRYNTVSKLYIVKDVDGINYKEESLYQGDKILVRKTGVGITAGMDYNNCVTNQVVYVLKKKSSISELISNEVVIAVLNSRVITYHIIKKYGNNGWKTHPYLSQSDVSSLPFPTIDIDNPDIQKCLKKITQLVRDNSRGNNDEFPCDVDLEIEKNIAKLFNLKEEHYVVIMNTIRNVEPMVPFKRLLNNKEKMILKNGI